MNWQAITNKGGIAGDASLKAAMSALFASITWAIPDSFTGFVHRLDTCTTTEADRAMLDSLPSCRYFPQELVRLVEGVRDKF